MQARLLTMDELEGAAGALGVLEDVVSRIGADDVGRQTPCREYDVASLTVHLRRSIDLLGAATGAQLPDADPDTPVREQLIPAARAALRAWQRRGVEGDIELGPQPFPARLAVSILGLEYLVHAWDYANALGVGIDVPDDLAQAVLDGSLNVITPEGRKSAGFDDPIDLPDGAGPMERLVAFTGRRPR